MSSPGKTTTNGDEIPNLDDNGDDVIEDDEEAPSHLPFAPASEMLDDSTVIDPGYIISLIRHLLPNDPTPVKKSHETEDSTASLKDDETTKNINIGDANGECLGSEEVADPWEDSGCILWDLSATSIHAELMVNNLILEVLLANLRVSESARTKEICLGIIGNLSCHDVLASKIVSTEGMTEAVVDQLQLEDSACLSEVFRTLTVNLQNRNFVSWAEVLLLDHVLLRILWIIENTLNSTLLEKSMEFLLVIAENQEVGSVLLQPLMKLGLANVIASLLACEIGKLENENKLERISVIDLILSLIEAVSATNDFAEVLSSNEELFDSVCRILKLPEKTEVSSCCASSVVIIANALADEQRLVSRLCHDSALLVGLLDVLPLVSDDDQARDALWCIILKLLIHVDDNLTILSSSNQFVSSLLDKFHLIEEDLDSHVTSSPGEDLTKVANIVNSSAVTTSLRKIVSIIGKWEAEKSTGLEKNAACDAKDYRVQKMLDYCYRYG